MKSVDEATSGSPTKKTKAISTGRGKRKKTDLVVVHCAATRRDQDIGVAEIDKWHKDKGWAGIGYHLVIRRDGTIEHGEPLENIGAHAYGYHRRSVGICLVGGLDDNDKPTNNFNSPQLLALKAALEMVEKKYPDCEILGHRDLSPDIDGDGVIES